MNTRRAFTLIEVLLAVFIIGLGSIGLFALFAGVAEQQGRANETNVAVRHAQSVIAKMDERLGRVSEPPDPMRFDPVFDERLADGVWYPIFMYETPSDPLFGDALTVAPMIDSAYPDSRYFVVTGEQVEVYSNPPVYNGTNYEPRDGSVAGGAHVSWSAGVAYNDVMVREIPHRRVEFGSVRVEIFAANTATGGERMVASFVDSDYTTTPPMDPSDASIPMNPGPTDPSITFNYGDVSWGQGWNELLGLVGIDLPMGTLHPGEWVSSVRMRYSRRNDRLIGLGDRIVYTPDPSRPSGRRAEYGATLLYRRTASGRTQIGVLTYAITPLDREGEFVPPEQWNGATGDSATHGLLDVYPQSVLLWYDEEAAQYYLDGIDLEPGDIVLVGGRLDVQASDDLVFHGADNAVRVTRVVDDQVRPRAYIDDAPRVGFRPMLESGTGPAILSRVYVMRKLVQSAADGRQWRLRPIDLRVFDRQ